MTLRHAQGKIILAIETSLDDTSAAVTRDNCVLSNVVASQVKFHEEWGGTVPDIARRKHQEWMESVIQKAIKISRVNEKNIDAIAVTYGPGLAPSLEVGIDHAKMWAIKLGVPLIPVNHLEGHLLSVLAMNRTGKGGLSEKVLHLPALGFLISGGHTELVLIKNIGDYVLLGETLDDAAGEAYDKVARMLKLGYPGGPILSEMAKEGMPKYHLPTPMVGRKDLNFSFSGLKTAALNALKKLEDVPHDRQFVADFSASFQQAALNHLMKKLDQAILLYSPKTVLLGGGVVSNVMLRNAARTIARRHGITITIPYTAKLFTDNAGMIGVAAWYIWKQKRVVKAAMEIERQPNLNFPRM
jgi:N6-L-threonylcarbamoyladenine synthase